MPDMSDSGIGEAGYRLKLFNETSILSDSVKLFIKERRIMI